MNARTHQQRSHEAGATQRVAGGIAAPAWGSLPARAVSTHARTDAPVDYELVFTRRASSSREYSYHGRRAKPAAPAPRWGVDVIAHDLRAPLSHISLGAAMMLEDDLDESRVRQVVDLIQHAVQRMSRLIQDLSDTTAVDNGGLAVQPRLVDLTSMLREVAATAELLASNRFVLEFPTGTVAAVVDPDRLLQVFFNLMTNALKFADKGPIVVTAELLEQEIRFAVSDTGPGIPAHQLPRIFEPYWCSGRAGGTGIGLAIARTIVEAHGGRIWAESAPGAGTRFYFTVPR
jgi:two-component system, chemotaxis family, sensor kinase Cph1